MPLTFIDVWPESDVWPDGPKGAAHDVSLPGRILLDQILEEGDTLVSVETLKTPTGHQFARLWVEQA